MLGSVLRTLPAYAGLCAVNIERIPDTDADFAAVTISRLFFEGAALGVFALAAAEELTGVDFCSECGVGGGALADAEPTAPPTATRPPARRNETRTRARRLFVTKIPAELVQ